MAVLSWCDVFVDGENRAPGGAGKDYRLNMPVDTFLAGPCGHNFGLATYMLDQWRRAGVLQSDEQWAAVGSRPVDHFFGLCLLHDTPYWMAFGRWYRHTIDALRGAGFDESWAMAPYWRQKVVQVPEGVYATFYRRPDNRRAILVLLNNTERNLDLALGIDWGALGFEAGARVRADDSWAASAVPPADPAFRSQAALCRALARIEQGILHTPVGQANMRLLVLDAE